MMNLSDLGSRLQKLSMLGRAWVVNVVCIVYSSIGSHTIDMTYPSLWGVLFITAFVYSSVVTLTTLVAWIMGEL